MNNNHYDEKQIELRKAMSRVTASVEAIPKTETAGMGKWSYKHANLFTVNTMLLPALNENNLTISHEVQYLDNVHQHVLRTIVSHENGAYRESVINIDTILDRVKEARINKEAKINKDTAEYSKIPNILHEVGGALTYFKRYMILGLFDIPTEDDDGQALSASVNERFANKTVNNAQVMAKPKNNEQNEKAIAALKELCKNRSINVAEFSKMHGVRQSQLETIEKIIDNFEMFATQYEAKYVETRE